MPESAFALPMRLLECQRLISVTQIVLEIDLFF